MVRVDAVAGKLRHFQKLDGRYYTRIAIPKALRPFLDGKRELRHFHGDSLKKAERDHPGVEERFLTMLDRARAQLGQTGRLSQGVSRDRPMSLGQFARWVYSFRLSFDRDCRDASPGYSKLGVDDIYRDDLKEIVIGRASNELIEATIGDMLSMLSRRSTAPLASGSLEWRSAARELAGVELEVLRRLYEREEGEPDGEPTHHLLIKADPAPATSATPSKGPPVSILGLLDGYLNELAKSGGGAEARRRWTPCFKDFVRHLDHDDARLITKQDVIDWKDDLLERLAPKTVHDTNIASLRAVLTWAIDNKRIPDMKENPAVGVKVKVTKKVLNRDKGFTTDEAALVLKAARNYEPAPSSNPATRETQYIVAAKRWTPWLCAFSGARISEMTQIRSQDVRLERGIHYLRITPEAGSVKTGVYRDVPLHPQLIELGFLEFVASAPAGALFYDDRTERDSKRHPAKYTAQRMATWVRSLKLAPVEVDPNHGWRHRFKTIMRDVAADHAVVDAIQGHAARTAGENYGNVSLEAKAAAIQKLPRYDVDEKDEPILADVA